MHHIIVSVKEDEIQMEGNKAEKDEREFVYQPLTHLPWAQLDEKGMTFHWLRFFFNLKNKRVDDGELIPRACRLGPGRKSLSVWHVSVVFY